MGLDQGCHSGYRRDRHMARDRRRDIGRDRGADKERDMEGDRRRDDVLNMGRAPRYTMSVTITTKTVRRRKPRLNGRENRRRLIRIGTRDNWICQLCHMPVTPVTSQTMTNNDIHRASVDHIIPVRMGGSDDYNNLRLAHQSCNAYRDHQNNRPFAEYSAIDKKE